MKYFSAKALAGAILYQPDTNEALLINTVEIYGRNSLMDPHFERSRLSYPPKDIKYPNVWPVSTSTPDGLKLIIGTNICNYLVTSSIRIDKKVEPEVGPSTNAFVLDTTDKCNKVQIYLDRRMYQRAKELGKDANCTGIEPSNSHYQLRQLCSEFDELETYAKMKASFDLLNFLDDQPVTIYTLAAHPKALPSEDQDGASDDIVASRLFFNIASEVIGRNYNARLEKEMVISLLFRFKDPNQQIPKLFKEIISLYGENEEYIHIISNDALNRKLVQLAGKLASYITKANKDIIENIKAVFDYN
jgi:hypothetical protein